MADCVGFESLAGKERRETSGEKRKCIVIVRANCCGYLFFILISFVSYVKVLNGTKKNEKKRKIFRGEGFNMFRNTISFFKNFFSFGVYVFLVLFISLIAVSAERDAYIFD